MFQVIELDAEKIKGQKFGRLLVVDIIPNPKRKYGPLAVCLCECGQQVTTRRSKILGGDVRSCGCLKRERFRKYPPEVAVSKPFRRRS